MQNGHRLKCNIILKLNIKVYLSKFVALKRFLMHNIFNKLNNVYHQLYISPQPLKDFFAKIEETF